MQYMWVQQYLVTTRIPNVAASGFPWLYLLVIIFPTILGKDCVSAIQSAMAEVDKQSKDSKSWKLLEKRFR